MNVLNKKLKQFMRSKKIDHQKEFIGTVARHMKSKDTYFSYNEYKNFFEDIDEINETYNYVEKLIKYNDKYLFGKEEDIKGLINEIYVKGFDYAYEVLGDEYEEFLYSITEDGFIFNDDSCSLELINYFDKYEVILRVPQNDSEEAKYLEKITKEKEVISLVKGEGDGLKEFEQKQEELSKGINDYLKGITIKQTPKTKEEKLINILEISKKELVTKEEKELLNNFENFGNVSKLFDETNIENESYRTKIKSILTESEYNSLKKSTLTGYYTPNNLIKIVYKNLNIESKDESFQILEPSSGTGRFIKNLPKELQRAKITTFDIDENANRINKLINSSYIENGQMENFGDFTKFDFGKQKYNLIITNVPFSEQVVEGKKIHDFYFSKAIDLLSDDGVAILITSTGTMDKKNTVVREEIKKHFVSAFRLPNNVFSTTTVASDIIILKKDFNMERNISISNAVSSKEDKDILINEFFINNPQNILGEVRVGTNLFAKELKYKKDNDYLDKLGEGISKLNLYSINKESKELISNNIELENKEIKEEIKEKTSQEKIETLSLGQKNELPNFEYKEINNEVFIKLGGIDNVETVTNKEKEVIKDYISFKNKTLNILDYQTNGEFDNSKFEIMLNDFNIEYDNFIKNHNYFNTPKIRKLLQNDIKYPLISSLEEVESKNKKTKITKGKIFKERVNYPPKEITSVNDLDEAIIVSLSKNNKIDLKLIAKLMNIKIEEVLGLSKGKIYVIPNRLFNEKSELSEIKLEVKEEFLSGNINKKIKEINIELNKLSEIDIEEKSNLYFYQKLLKHSKSALLEVQPQKLKIDEIKFNMSSNWLSEDIIKNFILDEMMDKNYREGMKKYNKNINIVNDDNLGWVFKHSDLPKTTLVSKQYGLSYKDNAYEIIKASLKQQKYKVYKTIMAYKDDGKEYEKRVIDEKKTLLAKEKQEQLETKFEKYARENYSEVIEEKYNDLFNSLVSKQYDKSYIKEELSGGIKLREHQERAVSRVLLNKNTLLGHVVGSGKTFEMIVSGKKIIELGQSSKNLYVVPNHIVDQFAKDFYKIYPNENILVTSKKDFEKNNRKVFLSKIALGGFNHIIMGHSQFDLVTTSKEYQEGKLRSELNKLEEIINEANRTEEREITVKQLEQKKNILEKKIEKFLSKKFDETLNFEQLGIGALFVDEAHEYKNLQILTTHGNVKGINTSASQKAYNMKMKIEQLNAGGGKVIFATGTPLTNSITEMYSLFSYLYEDELENDFNINSFDKWLSTFGEIETTFELTPEGSGFKETERVNKFINVPELSLMFSQIADIVTNEDIDLPIPKAKVINEVIEKNDQIAEHVENLGKRAEKIRGGTVDPRKDNFLKITTDGRKLACDVRLFDKEEENIFENIKLNKVIDNIYKNYQETNEDKLTQIVFCDIGTPKKKYDYGNINEVISNIDSDFDVYNYVKLKLIQKGIEQKDIQFIHDYKNESQKEKLFEEVNSGKTRILLGSTSKLGAGTNIQKKLKALHHIDITWTPANMEQREGRILRQGNINEEVNIYRYTTKDTFDSYSWNLLDKKHTFIKQIMKSKVNQREFVDEDTALSFSEIKSLSSGDKNIKKIFDLQQQIKVEELKQVDFANKINEMKTQKSTYERQIRIKKKELVNYKEENKLNNKEQNIIINGNNYDEVEEKGKLIDYVSQNVNSLVEGMDTTFCISEDYEVKFKKFNSYFKKDELCFIHNKLGTSKIIEAGDSVSGNITRIKNYFKNLDKRVEKCEEQISVLNEEIITIKTILSEENNSTKVESLKLELEEILSESKLRKKPKNKEENIKNVEQKMEEEIIL